MQAAGKQIVSMQRHFREILADVIKCMYETASDAGAQRGRVNLACRLREVKSR